MSPSATAGWKRLGVLCVIWTVCTLPVLGKFDHGFVLDDVKVVGTPFIHQPERIGEALVSPTMVAQGQTKPHALDTYRPIPLITFFWDAAMSGHEPWSFHVTNHVLHLAVVSLLFLLILQVMPESGWLVASFAALWFGLNPQLAEAHVWINGRSDPLAALFGVLALWLWNPTLRTPSWPRSVAVAFVFLLGLLSKEVLALGVVPLLLWPHPQRVSLLARVRAVLPFGAAGLAYTAMRVHALQGVRAGQDIAQVTRALRHLPLLWLDAIQELLLPTALYLRNMRDDYRAVVGTPYVLQLVALAAITVGALWLTRRSRLGAWAIAWFACVLAPVSMISTMYWPGFGRYLYIPAIAVSLAFAEGLSALRTTLHQRAAVVGSKLSTAALAGVLGVVLVASGLQLSSLSEQYVDNVTLYSVAAERAPRPAYAYASLGAHYVALRDFDRGVFFLRKAADMDSTESAYLNDLVRALLMAGQPQQAAGLARGGIQRAPADRVANLRGMLILALAGPQPEQAIEELCVCLTHQPDAVECTGLVPRLLDPRGPQFMRLRHAYDQAIQNCPAPHARAVLQQLAPR